MMLPAIPSPSNPKRGSRPAAGKAAWYSYYAGFSTPFVQDVIGALGLRKGALIADPWNGSGTTTQVAHDLGFSALGYDLNPAMVIVGKARLLGCHTDPSHATICGHILQKAAVFRARLLDDEPLETWFAPTSAASIRNVERAIQHFLLDTTYRRIVKLESFEPVSSLTAFFYVALFRTVRHLLAPFHTSNPTWIKAPSHPSARLRPSFATVAALLRLNVEEMTAVLPSARDMLARMVDERPLVTVNLADSTNVPSPDGSIDAVISSPPYCTRIDYAIATRPELAILGYGKNELRNLRERMIGTATIAALIPEVVPEWGTTCQRFLARVEKHTSHASRSYYLKNHLQYFDGLFRSLSEINRVLRPGSPCVLVVQDSHYKELRNNLARVVREMGDSLGWTFEAQHDFKSEFTMAAIHSSVAKYRTKSPATESVVWLTRP